MNEHRHLTGGELIAKLYSAESETCPECRVRLLALEGLRVEAAASEEVSAEFLARQRRTIYARMGARSRPLLGLAPALATAAVVALAIGLFVRQPARQPARTPVIAAQAEVGDSQLFSELVSMEQSAEPRAALPIRALFEGTE
jgi:hypothetical protein